MPSKLSRDALFLKENQPYRIPAAGYEIILHSKQVGALSFPSSRMVVCDPFNSLDTEPFERTIERDSIPVDFIFADLRDETVLSYAILKLSETLPVRWEPAKIVGGDDSTWRDPEGFRVENSLVAIIDEESALDLMELEETDPEEYEKAVLTKLRTHSTPDGLIKHTLLHHKELVEQATDNAIRNYSSKPSKKSSINSKRQLRRFTEGRAPNVVIFESEDGFFPCFWGYDRDNQLSMFVIDFGVLEVKFTPYGLR